MVTLSTHAKLFCERPYPGSTPFDNAPEPPLLQLGCRGVIGCLDQMADHLLTPYAGELALLLSLGELRPPIGIPWELAPKGWFLMDTLTPIEYPPCTLGVLDGETLVKDHEYPVMAVYLGSDGVWYAWKTPAVGEYIPLKPRSLIIGHNVSYDAALIKGPVKALDTQVLATQVSGFCTDQQWISYTDMPEYSKPMWAYKGFGKGNYKSLKDTAEFYLKIGLDKTERNLFVEADSIDDLIPEWASLLNYCANDVRVTFEIFKRLYPLWGAKAPHSVSLWGVIVANSYRFPLTPDWYEWLAHTEEVYATAKADIIKALVAIADSWVEQGLDPADPWMSQLDWTIKPKTRVLKGYPEWYRTAKGDITLSSVLGHRLLKVQYLGLPVMWSRKLGYYTEAGKIPHPDGKGGNVGYLFSQDLTPLFDSGALTSTDPDCQRLIELAYSTAYWRAVRKRALNVRVQDGWVVPQTGGGTVTGRVTEPLWLTTCDPKSKRIGSELKSRIQPPAGYKLLMADFSGQEMRIAWLLGDARVGVVGGTPMSKAGIAGDKALKTDCHSLLSAHLTHEAGVFINREVAKVAGYAIQYGAGAKAVGAFIRQHCPTLSAAECHAIAEAAISFRKGRKVWVGGRQLFVGGTDSESLNAIAEIANSDRPRTPLLSREMPDPLLPLYVGREYVTTRFNYVIQAPARDQLDCLCVGFEYLAQHFGVKAEINWSRHDEVLVVCPEDQVTLAVECLQQAHAWTWAALHEALGLYQVPTIGLWFDDVNVDTVCRKGVEVSCVTPSNPVEAPKGYIITPQEIKGFDSWRALTTP